MKAIGIIGYHHSGKTTLATALISALCARGFKVSSLKDIHNAAYRADSENSNSWKHAQAGASRVLARGTVDSALVITPSPSLSEALPLLTADWLVIEGLKTAAVPKLVCADNEQHLEELVDDTCIGISGRIADKLETWRGLPVFCLQKHMDYLMQTVLERCFPILPQSDPECCSACGKNCHAMASDILQRRARREDCVQDSAKDLRLFVGSQEIVIVPFVQKLLRDNIVAFVNNLKGIDPDAPIKIEINR